MLIGKVKNWFYQRSMKKKCQKCGDNVTFAARNTIVGKIKIGNDVSLGINNIFYCSIAQITIGNHVMFGPNVTMISGDHRVDIPGKYMSEVKEDDKIPENDSPIVLEGDNWIGANSTILKGVTIGIGAVVAAGAVVTKDVPPYSIVGGIPAQVISQRFSSKELDEHLRIMLQRENK